MKASFFFQNTEDLENLTGSTNIDLANIVVVQCIIMRYDLCTPTNAFLDSLSPHDVFFLFIIQPMWMRKYSSKLLDKKFCHYCFWKCHVTNLTTSVIDYLQQLSYIRDDFLEETSIKSNIYEKKWSNLIWNISCKVIFRKLRNHDKNRKEKYETFLWTLF